MLRAGKFDAAKTYLAERLRQLGATGADGFEGLMRDVLTELTGQSYRLAKSGPQGGSDVRTIPTNSIRIGLEAKRYGETTTLALDALSAKVVEAAYQTDPVDLWILAATREITVTDLEALAAIGRKQGLTVLVFDWPPQNGFLPDLAVLCALAPAALARHLGTSAALADAMEEIERHPDFLATSERLRNQLHRADIGYAAAADTLRSWIKVALESKRDARARLGGFNNLLEPGVKLAPRPALFKQLDQWFGSDSPGALVGDEGVGKTWLILSWWWARENAANPLPLTIFLSARDIRNEDAEHLVARLLAKRAGIGDEEFWLKRLHHWRRAEADHPQILLVIDGLNQNWLKKDWADFLQPLYESEWAGLFAVLLSSWPDHWAESQRLTPLSPAPAEIQVGLFDDNELDALLELHGCNRSTFSRAMLNLMKVPRLSVLALEQREALAASGDITPERLAYEDWKHRISRKGAQLGISDEEFKAFVRDLGSELRTSIDTGIFTRKELFELLGKDSGKGRDDLLSTVGELIAGRWLEKGDKPHHFRINQELAPFALGLTLAYELRGALDEAGAAQRIAEFVDPFKAHRLGVAILRAATTAALLDPEVGRPARRAIFGRWISEQNFSPVDFEAYWRIIGLDTELVCRFAEDMWLTRGGGGAFTDEVVIKGFANAYQFPEVSTQLVSVVVRWLGWVWPDPDCGRFLGEHDPTTDRSKANQRRTIDNLERWRAVEGTARWPAVQLACAGDPSWLSHRVFGILSFLPRQPFTDAFVAWGLSRGIMGEPCHFDELAWVIRLNDKDAEVARPALVDAIDRLEQAAEPEALRAAEWLLEATGDSANAARAGSIRSRAVSRKAAKQLVLPPVTVNCLDPAATPPDDPRARTLDGAKLWHHDRQSGSEDVNFERFVPLLARSSSTRLRDIVGEAAASAENRTMNELRGLAWKLPRIMLVLSDAERGAVASAIDSILASEDVTDARDRLFWRSQRLKIELWGRSGLDQLTALLATGMDPDLVLAVANVIDRPGPAVLKSLLPILPLSGSRDAILGSLLYLEQVADDEALAGWEGIAPLIGHSDDQLRMKALDLAPDTHSPAVMRAVAASGWNYQTAKNRLERAYGSHAIVEAADVLGNRALIARADPEAAAFRLCKQPEDPQALSNFNVFLRSAVEKLDRVGARSIPEYWGPHQEALRLLVRNYKSELLGWLIPWIDKHKDSFNVAFIEDEFPLIGLCDVLVQEAPEVGLPMWRRLDEQMKRGVIRNARVPLIPIRAPDGPECEEAREFVLNQAVTDQDLLKVAYTATKYDKTAWLEAVIRRDEGLGRPERAARAYTLLGFTNQSPAFDAVWSDFDHRRPTMGWLTDVYRTARRAYCRNVWARHWCRCYLEASDPATAFAAYELLASTLDSRAWLWLRPELDDMPPTAWLRAHWDMNLKRLDDISKASENELKDKLFATRTMARTHAPWL